jgi:hypothetical protein
MVSILTACWMVVCTSCGEDIKVLSAQGLTHVPKNLSVNLVTLDLSNNNITTVEKDDFRTLKQVKTIDLSYNQIQILHESSFENLRYLEVLNISFNNIVHLPHHIFSKNQNLKKLYLKNNKLNITGNLSKAEHILDSQSLEHLDISFCNMTFISCEALKGLPNLTTLITNGTLLTQQKVGISNPHINLKAMKADLCNSSTFYKSCCDFQKEDVGTAQSIPPILTDKVNGQQGIDRHVLYIAIPMCVVVFIIVVTSYFLYNFCARRKTEKIAIPPGHSVDEIQRRPLPRPPLPNGGYEAPILPSNGNCGYVPVTSAENESLINTGPATYHVSMETIHASVHSLSDSTKYQANTPTNMDIYSDSDVNEEEDNDLPGPSMKGKCLISTTPYFSGANHPSTTGIPPRLGPKDDVYLERKKNPTRPTPTSPASPIGNVTKFFVKQINSEKVYVSSTSIELGQNSLQTVPV